MTSSAFWSYGSQFQVGDGGVPEAFTTVAEVMDITPPPMSRDDIDVTNQSSPSPGWKEFIPGWRDGDNVTFNMNWLPTNATQNESTGLLKQFNDNLLHNYRIVLPSGIKTVSFSGYVSGFEPDLPLEEQGQVEITIKVSGAVTVA